MAEVVELQKLKLAELKQECAARGLEVKGNKGDLIARLQAYLEEHVDLQNSGDEEVNEEEVLGEEPEELTKVVEEAIVQKEVKKQAPPPAPVPEKKVVKITPPISLDERLQKRAERFNVPPSTDAKKAIRAARFGIPVSPPNSTQGSMNNKPGVNVDVLKKRAQRFGMNVSSLSKKVEEDEKLKKRKERFGIITSAAAAIDDTEVPPRS
uniref:SAP domain containing ribonucleoprotein n=1 Tax=Scleropages formosus TaxID=113540 RepID=A0A8C9SBF1_SCLFO